MFGHFSLVALKKDKKSGIVADFTEIIDPLNVYEACKEKWRG